MHYSQSLEIKLKYHETVTMKKKKVYFSSYKMQLTYFTFNPLADAFVQSILQMRRAVKQSGAVASPSQSSTLILLKKCTEQKVLDQCVKCSRQISCSISLCDGLLCSTRLILRRLCSRPSHTIREKALGLHTLNRRKTQSSSSCPTFRVCSAAL